MLKFTNSIEAYTTTQRTTKARQFMEFTSKKQLQNAEILTGEEIELINEIKGTFSFAVHVDMRYVAVTLYRANAEKKYSFLVLDLRDKAIAEVDSIKTAKAEILALVNAHNEHDEAVEEDTDAHIEDTSEEHTEKELQA